MKRECLFKNDFNRFVVYSLCIIVTFISFLALSPNVLAQGTYYLPFYDYGGIPSYPYLGWDAFLPSKDYQYSGINQYGDQLTLQGLIADPGMSTAQYAYSHKSGASLENTYTQNMYTNPAVSALPARSRNMLFEFWMNTGAQSFYPGSVSGSGSGSSFWFTQSRSPDNPSPSPRQSYPIPDIWGYSGSSIIWGPYGGMSMGAFSSSLYSNLGVPGL